MELGFLILTDHSEALNGKVYIMGGGWNALRLPQLPHEWSFGIALGIDVPWNETNRRHQLAVHIDDPDGERLGDPFAMEFEAGRPPGSIDGQDQRLSVSLLSSQTFAGAGPHAVVVTVAGQEIGRSRFYVSELPPELLPTHLRQT